MSAFTSLIENIGVQRTETVNALKVQNTVTLPMLAAPPAAIGSVCLNVAGTAILIRNAAGGVTTIS